MKKSFYGITLLISLFSSTIVAQDSDGKVAAKNAVYLSAGSIFFYNSMNLNYDLRIRQSDRGFFKSYYINMEAGVFSQNSGFAPGPSSNGIVGGLGFVGLTGKGKHHFETGLGISINVETAVDDNDLDDEMEKETFVLPDIAIGYRFQEEKGLVFRTGIGLPQAIYAGVGYSF